MTTNANWPLMDEAVSFASGPNQPMPAPFWCSVLARTEGQWTSQRGRQYELDQVQTGQTTSTLRNDDGAFDSTNAASPFYPQVKLYRAYRRRAQYPATVNLLTGDQATAGAATPLPTGVVPPNVTGLASLVTVGSGVGTAAYQWTDTNPLTNAIELLIGGWTLTPGQQISGQLSIWSTSGSTPAVALGFAYYDATGTLISTTLGTPVTVTGAAHTITVTDTPPANAAGAYLQVQVTTGTGSSAGFGARAAQVQPGAVSSWVQPGTWYDMFTGYVNRWPQSWGPGGNYGVAPIQTIDAFGYLSQRTILSPAYMEMLNLDPDFFFPLDEPSGSASFADLTANRKPMNAVVFPPPGDALSNTFEAGQELTVALTSGSTGYLPLGIGGPVVEFTAPITNTYFPGLDLGLTSPTGVVGPPDSSSGLGWTRIFGFNAAAGPAERTLWSVADFTAANNIWLLLDPATHQITANINAGGTSYIPAGAGPSLVDGGYHLVAWTMSNDGKTWVVYLDGQPVITFTNASDMRPTFDATSTELLGLSVFGTGHGGSPGASFGGAMTFVSGLSYEASAAQMQQLYTVFRNAGTGTTSASRIKDILRWGGWAGAQAEDDPDSGTTQQYGPSIDLQAAAGSGGTDVVTAMQAVVNTDLGTNYVDKSGAVTFHSRGARYAKTPTVIFGENTAAGEIPYTDVEFDYDPIRLINDVTLTQTSTGLAYRAIDQVSIDDYGDVPMQANVNTTNQAEIDAQLRYLLLTQASPVPRIETITVDVASTNSWAAVLGLEFGSCVQINRRPSNAPMLTFIGFIENIAWTIDDKGGATATFQVSPNPPVNQNAFVLGTSRLQTYPGSQLLTCTLGTHTLSIPYTVGPGFTLQAGAYPMTIQADAERIILTAPPSGSTSPQSFTGVTRGANGTTQVAHTNAPITVVGAGQLTY